MLEDNPELFYVYKFHQFQDDIHRRLVGKFLVDETGQIHVLEDHDGSLDELETSDHDHVARLLNSMQNSMYTEIVNVGDITSGSRPDLVDSVPQTIQNEPEVQGPVLYQYHRIGMGAPQTLKFEDGLATLDGHELSDLELGKLIENIRTEKATLQKVDDLVKSEDFDDLEKGVMRRIAPFNPQKERLPEQEEAAVARWQGPNREPEDRGQGYMQENPRKRALHKLAARTATRKNPQTGEREYLLHRGMEQKEYEHILHHAKPGYVNHPEDVSSWTSSPHIARGFSMDYHSNDWVKDPVTGHKVRQNVPGKVVSAWVPEKHISMVPRQYGRISDMAEFWDENSKIPKGKNDYEAEHEVIVEPHHNSQIAKPEEVQTLTNPSQTLHGRINSVDMPLSTKMRYRKSEEFFRDLTKADDMPEQGPSTEQLNHIKTQIFNDTKTGLGNKKAYEVFLHNPQKGVYVYINISKMNDIKDKYGHLTGDSVAETVGDVIKNLQPEHSFRLGGDNFVIFTQNHEQAANLIHDLKEKISGIPPLNGEHALALNVGVGTDPGNAEFALSQAKTHGNASGKESHELETNVYSAIPGMEGFLNN